jgi:hypothetical protein
MRHHAGTLIATTAIWRDCTTPERWFIGCPGGGDVFPIRGSTAITFQEDWCIRDNIWHCCCQWQRLVQPEHGRATFSVQPHVNRLSASYATTPS